MWDYGKNDGVNPRLIPLQSNAKYHWKCPICNHSWLASGNTINGKRKHGCPGCALEVAEKEILSFIAKGDDETLITSQFRDSTCKDKKTLPFDFIIQNWMQSSTAWLLESDGKQHFFVDIYLNLLNDVSKAKAAFDLNRKHDIHKMTWAVKNGYCLVRYLCINIRQSVHDPSKWQEWLRRVHAKHIVPCFENKTPPVIVFPESSEYRGMYEACVQSDKRFEEWVVWEPLL